MPFTPLTRSTPSAAPGGSAAGARPSAPVKGEAPAANPSEDAWLDRMRAQAARANAAMDEIIADMRGDGLLVPLPRHQLRVPLFRRSPLDADYWDNGQTIEQGE